MCLAKRVRDFYKETVAILLFFKVIKTMKTKKKKNDLQNVSVELDIIFGAPGTESRQKSEELAWEEYCVAINKKKTIHKK